MSHAAVKLGPTRVSLSGCFQGMRLMEASLSEHVAPPPPSVKHTIWSLYVGLKAKTGQSSSARVRGEIFPLPHSELRLLPEASD